MTHPMALVQHSSVTNEHYSPPKIVEPARRIFRGTIDLDPASCEVANGTVKATKIYTRQDDGLTKPWFGKVWLNPPGGLDEGGSVQKAWWWRVARAWVNREIEQAVVVCFNLGLLQTTQLDNTLDLPTPHDFPVCLPSSRVPYDRAEEADGPPGQSSLFGDAREPTVKSGKQPPGASAIVYLPIQVPWSRDLPMDHQPLRFGAQRRASRWVTEVGRFREEYASLGRCTWTREGW